MVILTLVEEQTEAAHPLSDKAKNKLKNLPSMLDELVDEFVKDARPLVENDKQIQTALAVLEKPDFKEKMNKLEASANWKDLVELGKKCNALFVHLLKKKPLDSFKDLAKEHPGVKANFSSSPEIDKLLDRFFLGIGDIVHEVTSLVDWDVIITNKESFAANPVLKKSHKELEDVLDVYVGLEGRFQFLIVPLFFDLLARMYIVDNGLLN
ncbi:hypothetical protein Trydic_g23277 [Trypoxylus dichotomus]